MTKLNLDELLNKYLKGSTLAALGKEYGYSHQYIHLLIGKLPGYVPRKPIGDGGILFDGNKYYKAGRYRLDTKNRKLLHRAIYEYFHGPIPPNHDIHHIDGNQSNNDIRNLIMLTKVAHTLINASERGHIGGKKSKRTWTPEQKEKMVKKVIDTLRNKKVAK